MTAVPVPRQVIDGDAVLAESRCTCIFQSSYKWYFINFVGKFGNFLGYAIWAAAVNWFQYLLILRKTDTKHYIYCPVSQETWRFVPPRKFMLPEGEAQGRREFSGWDNITYLVSSRRSIEIWRVCKIYGRLGAFHIFYKPAIFL